MQWAWDLFFSDIRVSQRAWSPGTRKCRWAWQSPSYRSSTEGHVKNSLGSLQRTWQCLECMSSFGITGRLVQEPSCLSSQDVLLFPLSSSYRPKRFTDSPHLKKKKKIKKNLQVDEERIPFCCFCTEIVSLLKVQKFQKSKEWLPCDFREFSHI